MTRRMGIFTHPLCLLRQRVSSQHQTAPNELVNTDLAFQVTAQDSEGATSIATVTITVNADNDGPTASAGGPQTVDEGDLVTLDAHPEQAGGIAAGELLELALAQVSDVEVDLRVPAPGPGGQHLPRGAVVGTAVGEPDHMTARTRSVGEPGPLGAPAPLG